MTMFRADVTGLYLVRYTRTDLYVAAHLNERTWNNLKRTMVFNVAFHLKDELKEQIMMNFTRLHIILHAHLGVLLSYPLLGVIFISFPSFQEPY